jgi:APA family basic amino acid/polyamine antiporter
LLVSSVLVSGLVLYNWNASFANRFTDVVLLATWMTLIAYAYAAAAEVVLFIRERELFTWAKLARDTLIASVAFAYSVWAIWGSGEEWLAKGFMLLLFGIPVFVWMKWRAKPKPLPEGFDPDRALLGHGPAGIPARAPHDIERRVPTAVN